MMKSSLSPPVEQLLVTPVRRHLLPAAACTTTGQGDDETAAKKTHEEGSWMNDDGSFNWAMLDAYVPTSEETLSDEEVVARMRAILNDKLAEHAAEAAASSPPPASPASGAPPTAAAAAIDTSSSAEAAAGQGRGQPRPGGGGGGGGRKGKGNAAGGGGGGSAETEAEREIARLEREEALAGAEEGEGGAAGEREKKLSEEARTYDLDQWEHIMRTALLLQKAAPHVHRYMMSLTSETFEATYASRFPAFHHHAPELPQVFALHREGKSIEALLQLAPLIERHISDLYLAATKGRGDGRLILRDLLLAPQLNTLFGPRKVGVLRSLIGTPLGLNIRNVAWHGFLSEADFYPGYVSLILALALSLVPSLRPVGDPTTTTGGGGSARHSHHHYRPAARPLLAIAPLVELTWRAESGGCVLLADGDDRGGHEDNDESRRHSDGRALAAVRRLLRRSGFVVDHSRFLLESAIDALERPKPPQYYQCLVCALPALEHCLRRLYVSANALPPPLLTAVMYDYYTTLDVIVGPTVEATGRPNLLRQELGDSIMTALWDFFVCPEGPRLRDRISHGEADPAGISRLLCDRVLGLVARLCLRYDRPAADDDGGGANDDDDASLFARVVAFYDGYASSFHTKDVLVRKLVHYFDAWAAFAGRHGPRPTDPLALGRERFGERGLLFANDDAAAGSGGGLERARASGLLRLPTLFLSSFELAAIVQLRIVVTLSERLISKIEERFAELKGLVDSRKARSRQRNSYAQLCKALPYYCAMSQYVGQLVEARLRLLDRLAQDEDVDGSDASSQVQQQKRERVLGELRQLVVCAEKQLSQLAQGDKWSDVCELFHDLFQATTACDL